MQTDIKQRQIWVGILAQALPQELEDAYQDLDNRPDYHMLRQPECGLAMVRGRAGGNGQAFNFGEMTITRASVTLGDYTGHAYIKGRNKRQAELAAIFDALLQSGNYPTLPETLIAPIADRIKQAKRQQRQKSAATKVEFFTMVRGESN